MYVFIGNPLSTAEHTESDLYKIRLVCKAHTQEMIGHSGLSFTGVAGRLYHSACVVWHKVPAPELLLHQLCDLFYLCCIQAVAVAQFQHMCKHLVIAASGIQARSVAVH